jgi:hypothetical protein
MLFLSLCLDSPMQYALDVSLGEMQRAGNR